MTQFTWVDPTTNVDGSPIAAGEVTGYTVGVRDVNAAGSVAGVYTIKVTAPASATASALASALPPGSYAAAVQTNAGPTDSAFSAEVAFSIAAPPPVPNAPTGFSVA